MSALGVRSVAVTAILAAILVLVGARVTRAAADTPRDGEFPPVDWDARGRQELEDALNVTPLWAPAKNVIIFIGDGMGVSTQTAARMYKAQKAGQSVTDGRLSWEAMPYTGLIKVYNTDQQAPDSAGTATAFYCGEKTRAGVIGVNQHVTRGNCSSMAGNQLTSILHHGIQHGKWTGIVSTSEFTAATTSSAFAHSPERNWKADVDVPEPDADTCWDLARQMVHLEPNRHIRVLQAGGRAHFMPSSMADPEYTNLTGYRADGRNLFQDWLGIHRNMTGDEDTVVYARNIAEFNATDASTVEYLLGCYEHRDMKVEADRELEDPNDPWGEPSLVQMVDKSLDILSRGPEGYILLAEGDRMDHNHHENQAYKALVDTLGLEQAVQLALARTNPNDTLILVTADHSHTLTIAGYPRLETDILGLVVDQDDKVVMADDDKPYLVLGYTNGPGYKYHRMEDGVEGVRLNLSGIDTTGREFRQDAGIYMESETHTAEDVSIYARGPMSHLFSGLHEQHYVAVAAMYAACVGPDTTNCPAQQLASAAPTWTISKLLILSTALVSCLSLHLVRPEITLLL